MVSNRGLEIKSKLIKIVFGLLLIMDQKHGPQKNEENFINAFEIWSCRRMLEIKWADRIMNDEVFQRVEKKDYF